MDIDGKMGHRSPIISVSKRCRGQGLRVLGGCRSVIACLAGAGSCLVAALEIPSSTLGVVRCSARGKCMLYRGNPKDGQLRKSFSIGQITVWAVGYGPHICKTTRAGPNR